MITNNQKLKTAFTWGRYSLLLVENFLSWSSFQERKVAPGVEVCMYGGRKQDRGGRKGGRKERRKEGRQAGRKEGRKKREGRQGAR
jgi:hypothetical protein